MKQEKIQNHQQNLMRTQNYIQNRIEAQKSIIKEDEEFLRQLEFEINQLMISSWPPMSSSQFEVKQRVEDDRSFLINNKQIKIKPAQMVREHMKVEEEKNS